MENQEQEQKQVEDLKCVLVVGLKNDGGVFIETHGKEPNLITLDGLIGYAKRYVEAEWALRTKEELKVKTEVPEVPEEAEAVEVELV